jgi:hemoglobin/transferrin/lactoferrin receptor protein
MSVFRTDYDNFIETKVRLGQDPESGRILFQSQNINAALIDGVEAGWSISAARFLTGLRFDGAVYWARGENRDTGQPLNSVGPAQATLGLDWASDDDTWNTRLHGTFTHRWSQRDESASPLFKPSGYAVFDVFLSKRVSDQITARMGVLNIGDRTYWSWSDVRGLAPDSPVIPYVSRPGITVTVGLDLSW